MTARRLRKTRLIADDGLEISPTETASMIERAMTSANPGNAVQVVTVDDEAETHATIDQARKYRKQK